MNYMSFVGVAALSGHNAEINRFFVQVVLKVENPKGVILLGVVQITKKNISFIRKSSTGCHGSSEESMAMFGGEEGRRGP